MFPGPGRACWLIAMFLNPTLHTELLQENTLVFTCGKLLFTQTSMNIPILFSYYVENDGKKKKKDNRMT